MPNQTTFDDAQIRTISVQVEQLAHSIQSHALLLREKFDELHPLLQYVDPIKDVTFQRYMITLAHVKMLCDQVPSLAYQARKMQSYGKQQVSVDVSNLSHLTPAPASIATLA